MIPEIGHFALILAFLVALAQGVVPMVGLARRDAALVAMARPASLAQLALIAVAFAALVHAFAVSDFSVAIVYQNSHTAKPMLYKLAGVWGNHEGSLVLWVLILAAFGAAVGVFGANLPPALKTRVLAVQAWIAVGFLSFLLFTSNPFLRLAPVPAEGLGLNPLLQDPGLAFHPPFLYLGYVGLSVTFSFAIAALIEGRVDAAWARWVRPWTLAAWSALTVGITLGAFWAYYELGWGGFWFWDPVENASFMPWLAATALLHSAIVTEKRDALKSWTILLAIIAFSLSLLGTFLVRSGVLTSVHAFATDPARGLYILAFLIVAIGGSLALYAVRAPALAPGGLFAPVSREGALVLNNLLLSAACATVLLGTLYPLALDALGGGKVSVGPPYFDRTFAPLFALVVAVTALGPMMAWKRADLAGVLGRLKVAALAAIAVAGAVGWATGGDGLAPALGLGLAAWLLVGTLVELGERLKLGRGPLGESWRRARHLPRSAWGTTLAHGGLAVALAGVVAASAWRTEVLAVLAPGESIAVAAYTFRLDGVAEHPGPNYTARRGTFTVTRDGEPVAVMTPEKRFYPVQRQTTTEAAIHPTFLGDLYAVLGEKAGAKGWSVRLYFNPLVPWMWTGALVMVLGGLISLSDRRLRIGVPARRRRLAAAPEAA